MTEGGVTCGGRESVGVIAGGGDVVEGRLFVPSPREATGPLCATPPLHALHALHPHALQVASTIQNTTRNTTSSTQHYNHSTKKAPSASDCKAGEQLQCSS